MNALCTRLVHVGQRLCGPLANLKTKEKPSKWIIAGVALLLHVTACNRL